MQSPSVPAWEDYSSNSEEDEAQHSSSLISEATKQLFLRKYASSSLNEKELISIFDSSHYDDKEIRAKISAKLNELLLTHPNGNVKVEQDNYDYDYEYSANGNNNGNNGQYYKRDKYNGSKHIGSKYYKNEYYHPKGGYKGAYVSNKKGYMKGNSNNHGHGHNHGYRVNINNNNNGCSNKHEPMFNRGGYYSNKKYEQYEETEREIDGNANVNVNVNVNNALTETNETEVVEYNNEFIKRSSQEIEIDEDQRTTSKNSTTPSLEIVSIPSIEAIPEISLAYLPDKETKVQPQSQPQPQPQPQPQVQAQVQINGKDNKDNKDDKPVIDSSKSSMPLPMSMPIISPIKESNSTCYPSRLFPGVFFNKPIDHQPYTNTQPNTNANTNVNSNPLNQFQFKRPNNNNTIAKNPFAQAYNYYMLGSNNNNNNTHCNRRCLFNPY